MKNVSYLAAALLISSSACSRRSESTTTVVETIVSDASTAIAFVDASVVLEPVASVKIAITPRQTFTITKEVEHVDAPGSFLLATLYPAADDTIVPGTPLSKRVGALRDAQAMAVCYVATGMGDLQECAAQIDSVSNKVLSATVTGTVFNSSAQQNASMKIRFTGKIALDFDADAGTSTIVRAVFSGTGRHIGGSNLCNKLDQCAKCPTDKRVAGCPEECFCPLVEMGTTDFATTFVRE